MRFDHFTCFEESAVKELQKSRTHGVHARISPWDIDAVVIAPPQGDLLVKCFIKIHGKRRQILGEYAL